MTYFSCRSFEFWTTWTKYMIEMDNLSIFLLRLSKMSKMLPHYAVLPL